MRIKIVNNLKIEHMSHESFFQDLKYLRGSVTNFIP